MKINWALFFTYLFVWVVAGIVVFENIAAMIIFIISGGVCGGFILASENKKRAVCN